MIMQATGRRRVRYAAMKWPENPQARAGIKKYFQGEHGDRRQELVLIGVGMDKEKITAMLDAALLSSEEMRKGKIGWKQLPDPFPLWGKQQEAA